MIDSNYTIHFIKKYFVIIFYLLIIFNIVIRVIVTKKSKKKKKKSRKGGGILGDIGYVLLCIITFGWSCGFWQGVFQPFEDNLKILQRHNELLSEPRVYWSSWVHSSSNSNF